MILTLAAILLAQPPSVPPWEPTICAGEHCWFNIARPLVPEWLDRDYRASCPDRTAQCLRVVIRRVICVGPRDVPDGDRRLDLYRGNGASEEELRVRIANEATSLCGDSQVDYAAFIRLFCEDDNYALIADDRPGLSSEPVIQERAQICIPENRP